MGISAFVLLYVIATFRYPGGSQADQFAAGFSWAHNYWCNLLDERAINGKINNARPIALAAMAMLCLALCFFWWVFPNYTRLPPALKWTVQYIGSLAMLSGFSLFSTFDHDLVTNISSALGLVATLGTFYGLYKNRWMGLFYFGLLNILLVLANNFLYYNKSYIVHLPIVQKITFASFLLWICFITLKMFRVKLSGDTELLQKETES